jgi:hypothetical protein
VNFDGGGVSSLHASNDQTSARWNGVNTGDLNIASANSERNRDVVHERVSIESRARWYVEPHRGLYTHVGVVSI